jgi:surface protein
MKLRSRNLEVANPVKARAFFFIGCLHQLHARHSQLCFTPAFIEAMFGPYILSKKSRWDGDIKGAVRLWCEDPDAAEDKYGHISQWDVSHVTNMVRLFHDKRAFNEDIRAWDVSSVTTMKGMFHAATAFNQPLSGWDVSKVKDMECMFCNATAFNHRLAGWNVSKVKNMRSMFSAASTFNHPLAGWDVSNVEDMGYMFSVATAFNHPLAG